METNEQSYQHRDRNAPSSLFGWIRIVEMTLPLMVILLVILGWSVTSRYQRTLVNTAITSYQATQLEVVRAVARSIQPFLRDRLAEGLPVDLIEQLIFKTFVEPVHVLQSGDAWIYSPDHVVFDLSSDFPEIYKGKSMTEIFAVQKNNGASHYEVMCDEVSKATEGTGWYIWLPAKGKEIASWTPVRVGDYVWTIGLSTPLPEILQATGAEQQEHLIVIVMWLATALGCGVSLSALWGIVRRRQLQKATDQHNNDLQSMVATLEKEIDLRKKSEMKLQSLFQAVPVGLAIHRERILRSVNEKFCDITGYAVADIINQNARLFYKTEEEYNRVGVLLLDNLEETGTGYVETQFCRKDGELRDVALTAAPLAPSRHGAGAAVAIQDITERNKMERALRKSEFRFRSFYNSSPEGIILLNFQGSIIDVNMAFINNSGYSFSECIEKKLEDFIPGKYQKQLLQTIATLGSGLSQNEHLRISYISKNGEEIPISAKGWLVIDEEKTPLYLGFFVHDVSKEIVWAKEKANLEKQVIHAQKSEAIGTLAGGIAHDFNNILGGIIGYTELALHGIHTAAPDKTTNYLERVLEGANRAKELVKQILRFSKHSDSVMEPLHLTPVINEAINLLGSTLPTTIAVRHEVDLHNDRIVGDSTQILQVIMNLATNAYHVMRETGGILTITLEHVKLNSARQFMSMAIPPGEYLKLRVADTGTGIKDAVLERIFEPYFTTKEINEGSGLGMAVARGIIKKHKGLIEIETTLGKGTNIDVFLPFSHQHVAAIDYVEERFPQGNGQHVLVVDDEAYYLEVVEKKLEFLGYQVTACQSSHNALKNFKDNPQGFDLVITDQTMPEMTGVQLVQEIRKISDTVPVILCTGYSETVSKQSAKYYGITGFLMKPVSIHDMAELIHRVLQNGIA